MAWYILLISLLLSLSLSSLLSLSLSLSSLPLSLSSLLSLSSGAFLKDDVVVGSRQGDSSNLNTVNAIGHRGNRHRGRGYPQSINSGGGYLDHLVEPLGKHHFL